MSESSTYIYDEIFQVIEKHSHILSIETEQKISDKDQIKWMVPREYIKSFKQNAFGRE